MILKNRVVIVTILAILSLNGCGNRAGGTSTSSNKVIPTVDPCIASLDALQCDQDKDGLTNEQEINQFKTDPKNPDTDGDGLVDGYEEALATTASDPLNSCNPSQQVGYRGWD